MQRFIYKNAKIRLYLIMLTRFGMLRAVQGWMSWWFDPYALSKILDLTMSNGRLNYKLLKDFIFRLE